MVLSIVQNISQNFANQADTPTFRLTISDYRTAAKWLDDRHYPFHLKILDDEKSLRMVVRGLECCITIPEIQEDLEKKDLRRPNLQGEIRNKGGAPTNPGYVWILQSRQYRLRIVEYEHIHNLGDIFPVVGALENSLPNKQIVEALTAGVTYDLKKMIYTRNPQTPEEWLDYVNTIQMWPVTSARGQPTPQRDLDRWRPESTPSPGQGHYRPQYGQAAFHPPGDPFKVPTLHIQPVQIKPNTDRWTLECQKAFEDLKSSLTASPVLHIFKEDLPCFLYCDASTLGISGILKQKDENGEEHPVQYFFRFLRKYEQNYSISELECLAIIESIEYSMVYLLGRHFTIYSDDQALVYLKNIKNPSGRLFRWSLRLSPYTFDIHYLKDKKQLEGDLLSRQPFCGFLEAQQLLEHQHRVPVKYQSLINTDGIAIITKKGVPRVVVPDTLRNKLLQKAHEWYNHPGITQLTRLITLQYYWDGMTKDINNYVRKCKICQIVKPPKGPTYGEMGTLPLAKEPYELMSMDTVAGFNKLLLEQQKLLELLEGLEIKPNVVSSDSNSESSLQNWKSKDVKARMLLSQAIELKFLQPLMNCTSASQMWQKLLAIHEQKSEFTIGLLWQQFFDARLTSETISDYIAKIENISAQISQMGGTITEDQKVAKILNTLPSSMRYFVAAWESLDPKAQTLNNLTARLLIEETRNQQSGSSKQDEALLHRQARTKPKDTQRSFQDAKKNTKCHYCHKIGHWSRECRKRLANEKNKSKNLHDSKGSSSDYGLILCDNQVEPNDIWYADSGASCSMTFRREWFKTYTPFTSDHPIYLGDNSTLLAEGMGDIEIQAYVDGGWYNTYIRNVFYSPQLKKNLYSLSTSTRRGFNVIIKHDKLQIFMENDLKAVGVRHDGLYRMLFKVTSSSQGYFTSENKLQLWHERLAHLPVATLLEMATKGLVDGLQPQDLEGDFFFCEGCQLGKAHRKSCYPSDGKNYQLGNKIKVLRTDNTLEFKSDNFADLCKRFGIIHEFTAPYVHEQIGRIERDNRTIVEAARSMLNSRILPGFFWAEACNTATYILNRSATKQTPGTTPYELFFGTKPNVANYKIFGCNAYMHIPKENRKKWDNKSIKLMFLGYENTSKNFRLWDWKTRKIRISKDVTFNEKATPHSDRESTKPKEIIFQINSAPDESPVATTNIPVQEMLPVSDISSHPMITRSKVSNSQCNFAHADEPSNYIDAITSSDSERWKLAMDEEIDALNKNKTWTLERLADGHKPIGCKWVYKIKTESDGTIQRFKARLVAKGYSQIKNVDYFDTFSPVVRYDSLRILLSHAASERMFLKQFDVKTAFLNGELEELVYLEQPEGYKRDDNSCYRLHKKQSEDRASIFIHQSSYIDKILSKFNMADCIPASVPMDPSVILTKQDCPTSEQKEKMPKFPFREAVGSLMFASCVSRPDITYAVSQVSKFLEYPGPAHCTTVKNIFRYLKGTPHMGILFTGQDQLVGYSDSDFARDVDSRKSTTGYAFMMNGGTVSWASQRQPIIALSTTESKYIAACSAAKELIWIRRLLQGIGCDITKETELYIDNQAAKKLVENPVFHKRTKHID
ncbi:hypothetical protein LAZ67_X002600, partial [Cordylochernes scorpioides]